MKAEEKLQQAALNNLDEKYHFIGKEDSGLILPSKFFKGISKEMVEFAKSTESLEYWKEKEKLWTNEEVETLLGKAFDKAAIYAGFSTYYCTTPEKYAKEWFNQHKK